MFCNGMLRRTRLALASVMLLGGTLFTSCGVTDIRDSLFAGSLAGVKNAATNWVSSLMPDLTEFVMPFPGKDKYVIPPTAFAP